MSGEDPMYEITVDQPSSPKGTPIQIVGLGTFDNGNSYTVTKDAADAFRAHHTRQETVVDEETGAILGSRAVAGPTLLQASENMVGITVKTTDTSKKNDPNKANVTGDADTSRKAQEAVTTPAKDEKGGDSK